MPKIDDEQRKHPKQSAAAPLQQLPEMREMYGIVLKAMSTVATNGFISFVHARVGDRVGSD